MSDLLTLETPIDEMPRDAAEATSPPLTGWAGRDRTPPVARRAPEVPRAGDARAGTAVLLGISSPALLCGLESLVMATPGMRLVGAAQSLDEFLAGCARMEGGAALVDPFLGRQTIREFLEAVKAVAPALRIVLMTDAHQPHVVRESVRTGACGFVSKTAGAQEIRTALAEALQGRRYIAAVIAAQLAESLTIEDLTSREMQVLARLSLGDCNKAIARHLEVTVGTVKTHVRAIMCKLGSRSRTEAVLKAYRLGLVGLEA